jgi:hypothetical protein
MERRPLRVPSQTDLPTFRRRVLRRRMQSQTEQQKKFDRFRLIFNHERPQEIGLEQIDENVYRVCFCNTELGEFNSSEMRFRPAIRT